MYTSLIEILVIGGIVFVSVFIYSFMRSKLKASDLKNELDNANATIEKIFTQNQELVDLNNKLKDEQENLVHEYNLLRQKLNQNQQQDTEKCAPISSPTKTLSPESNVSGDLNRCFLTIHTLLEEKNTLLESNRDLRCELNKLNLEVQNILSEKANLDKQLQQKNENNIQMQSFLDNREKDLQEFLISKNHAFSYMASIFTDYQLIDYYNSEKYLTTKKRPALAEAFRIKDLRRQTQQYLLELNKTKYILNDLLLSFPELEDYLDLSKDEVTSSKDESDEVSPNIWNDLSDLERSQLLLDRYIKRRKSKWEIGRDYELYVGYRYSQLGYSVDYFGSNNKLTDMGRDLIVEKNGEIGIIQCKYWSEKKIIHEKHIAQLYGTVVSYIIEHNYIPALVHGIFITNIRLSETAKKFADYLDIKYKENYPIGDFPRIKCNIKKTPDGITKIYHLPTDQQYDNVKIENEGECFVFSAIEAEKLGFRHAYKWHNK